MAIVTVTEVELLALEDQRLLDFGLKVPVSGTSSDVYAIPLQGWAIGRSVPAIALELRGKGYRERLPIGVPRPDLAEAHPDAPHVLNSGFRVGASVFGLPSNFRLRLAVILRGERRVDVAVIRGNRTALPAQDSPLSPLLVTSLGRTGTTWLIDLLSKHPEIVARPAWEGEVKVASYWTEIFALLAHPGSYLQAIRSDIRGGKWYAGIDRQFDEPVHDASLQRWLGATQLEAIADFARTRITAFYERERAEQAGKQARFFAEKGLPRSPAYADMLRELFPGTREIFLVRDFRDMLCSIYAYNKRLGYPTFQRQLAASDEEYVRKFLGRDLSELVRGWRRRRSHAHLVRYEDLVMQPHDSLTELFNHLGVDPDQDVVESIIATSGEGAYSDKQRHGTSSDPAASVGRWRRELDPDLLAVCEEVFAEAYEEFGYPSAEQVTAASGAR